MSNDIIYRFIIIWINFSFTDSHWTSPALNNALNNVLKSNPKRKKLLFCELVPLYYLIEVLIAINMVVSIIDNKTWPENIPLSATIGGASIFDPFQII